MGARLHNAGGKHRWCATVPLVYFTKKNVAICLCSRIYFNFMQIKMRARQREQNVA